MIRPGNLDSGGQGTDDDVLELTPTIEVATDSPSASLHAELVTGAAPSFGAETTPLLHSRLRAVTILLMAVSGLVLVWALAQNADSTGTIELYRNLSLIRLVVLGGLLGVLYYRPSYEQSSLRGMEYALFGVLTLIWIYGRYSTIVADVQAGDLTKLLVEGREAMIGLLVLMVVYGLFIPNRWQDTARVVLTMALAPTFALVLFRTIHSELASVAREMLSWRDVSANVLIVVVGAVLATYGAAVLNTLREQLHSARKYGQYQLVHRLGAGGMGEVYLARHALMKRDCALKLIRPEASRDATALSRFEREVHATASLTHPHTIDIYDYGHTDDSTFYYVMEYLPGMSLDELIAKHGPLPAGRVIFLLRQVCGALAEAHDAGLIHRDLKPGNLFISERGGMCDFVKVLDFGLVKLTRDDGASQLTQDQVISGTPLYMAPEQAVGERGLDARCDIYALGAIAYHMLCGRPPFEDESPIAIMIRHASEAVAPPSHRGVEAPNDLEQVILRCLQKKPENRFENALALEQALAACAAATEWDSQKAARWWHALSMPTTGNVGVAVPIAG
jgi:serine/threonine-protein kinase